MWFKNLQVYRFTRPFELTAEQLETQLEACAFTPCGSQDMSRFGWTRPLGKFGSTLTHSANGQILICARKEEKMLPSTVVKEQLAEKVEAIEFEQGRPLKKKEKEALKEELLHTLLPRAFSRTANTYAWINPADGLLMVDAPSAKKAEDVLALLRKSIGSLPVVPVAHELVMLPGWEQSEGAYIEFLLAKKSGKTIRDLGGRVLHQGNQGEGNE